MASGVLARPFNVGSTEPIGRRPRTAMTHVSLVGENSNEKRAGDFASAIDFDSTSNVSPKGAKMRQPVSLQSWVTENVKSSVGVEVKEIPCASRVVKEPSAPESGRS